MSNSNHWTRDALIHAEQLVGEVEWSAPLDGEKLGIAADYLNAVAYHAQANSDDVQKRVARQMYLNAQAREEGYR